MAYTFYLMTKINYKLCRIIDKTYWPSHVLPRSDKTYSTSLKNPKIPVFQHLIMKNDIVFQLFQQKLKNGYFFSKSSKSNNYNKPEKTINILNMDT